MEIKKLFSTKVDKNVTINALQIISFLPCERNHFYTVCSIYDCLYVLHQVDVMLFVFPSTKVDKMLKLVTITFLRVF